METRTTRILVQRYNPESESEPFVQEFEIECPVDATVLDALQYIKDRLDGSLSFRWSCRMGICGSCSAVVNGKEVLTCQTYVNHCGTEITVVPLRNFPIIKDLVVDIDDAFEKMKSISPYIDRLQEKALEEGEHIQTPAALERLKKTSQCIKCMICYSACPVYGFDKRFLGPAAGASAYRYIADSRNPDKSKQLDATIAMDGVYKCSFVGACSAACPKRVDPAVALQRLKLMGVLRLSKKALKLAT